MDGPQHLTKEDLLRYVLLRYASGSWHSPGPSKYGQRGNAPSPSSTDRGRLAGVAARAETVGQLIVCVANAYDVALVALGRMAGLGDGRIGSVCGGSPLTSEESYRLKSAIEEIATRVCTQS